MIKIINMGLIPPLPCPESFPHCYLLSFDEGCEIHSFILEEKCGSFHDEGGIDAEMMHMMLI